MAIGFFFRLISQDTSLQMKSWNFNQSNSVPWSEVIYIQMRRSDSVFQQSFQEDFQSKARKNPIFSGKYSCLLWIKVQEIDLQGSQGLVSKVSLLISHFFFWKMSVKFFPNANSTIKFHIALMFEISLKNYFPDLFLQFFLENCYFWIPHLIMLVIYF